MLLGNKPNVLPDRYHTQPVEGGPIEEEREEPSTKVSPKRYGSQGRHLTQPITLTEKEKAEGDSTLSPLRAEGIQSRFACSSLTKTSSYSAPLGLLKFMSHTSSD